MTQYVSNPNATGSLSGWTKTSGTLTSTSSGARWVSSGGEVQVNIGDTGHNTNLRLIGMRIRRNTSASTWPAKVFIFSDGRDGGMQVDLRDVDFPVGQWVTVPTIGVKNAVLEVGFGFPDIDASRVYIMGPESGTLDCTFDHVAVYDDISNDATIDSSDTAFNYTGAVNSLARTFSRISGDECVATVKWTWDDGTTTTGPAAGSGQVAKSRAKTFPAPGIYAVTLESTMPPRAIYPGKADPLIAVPAAVTVSSTQNVTVPTGTLEAHFDYETDFLNVVVDATPSIAPSLSPLDGWAYNWGDGNTSGWLTTPYASHAYAAPGIYNVTLTVKDNATNRTDTEVKAVTIVAPPNPDNYFVAIRTLLSVAFTPSIQDGSSYSWTFGDGGVSTSKDPTHVYATAGTYSVTLTVNGSLVTTQDITVLAAYTPVGKLLEALRLEVSVPPEPGSSYNRLPNPSGELGGWGWVTPVTNSYLTGSTTSHQTADRGVVGAKLIYRSSGAGTQTIYSAAVTVPAGHNASAQLQCPYVDGYYRATLEALNAAGAVIGSSATTGFQTASATATVRTTVYLLPAGTVTARVRLNHYSNTSSGTPTVNKLFQFRRVMLATKETAPGLASLPYEDSTTWVDLIGPTSEIKIKRPPLDVGTLTAVVLDSAYDPAVDGRIRPGQRIRLRALAQDLSGNQQWQSIYTGKVRVADVEYAAAKGKANPGPKTTRITLNAVDALSTMAGTPEPRGVAKIDELPELLENSGVPFSVNGSTAQVPVAQITSYNANASVVDQVAITRDTDSGYAYVDREGVLQVREPAFMPTVAVAGIDESVFSDVEAGFSTEECINSVTIKWLRYTPAVGGAEPSVEEVVYGPYEDVASIEEWGRRAATFTMQGVENPTTIAAKASAILAANAQPVRIITRVTIPVRYVEDLSPSRALLDLYDLTRLAYARTGTDELARITLIEHTITPKKWRVDIGFSPDGAVASPQLTAQPPVQTTVGLPYAHAISSVTQFVPPTTNTPVVLGGDVAPPQGGVTRTGGAITVPRAGVYMLSARCRWLANTAGNRQLFIYRNRGGDLTSLAQSVGPGGSQDISNTVSVPAALVAGDVIDMRVYHNAGVDLSVRHESASTGLSVVYLGA